MLVTSRRLWGSDVARKARTFSDAVAKFAQREIRKAEYIRKKSIQETIEFMQKPVGAGGNMPVDTGFLRNSLKVALNTRPTGLKGKPKKYKGKKEAPFAMTVAKSTASDVVYAVYLAEYAVHQEYGSQGRPGRRFVALARLEWPKIVRRNTVKAKKIK